MLKLLSVLLFVVLANYSFAQVVNGYARVTNIVGNQITLSSTVGEIDETADTFDNGDYIILMQMQDNVIGSTANDATFGNLGSIHSAGMYEVRQIVSQVAGPPRVLTLDAAPTNTYNVGANSSVQVITFRRFGSPHYTSTSNMSALPWNGAVGGVLAIDVLGIFTLGHHLSANGAGFRGAPNDDNGSSNWTAMPTPTCEDNLFFASFPGPRAPKGEGIYRNTNPNYVAARGKILNGGGGGNSHNGGGGGGGNYSAGGLGGWGWNCETISRNSGGQGGISLNAHININRVFMGGGGGAGERNNGFDSYGGNGGGIIIIRANTIQTTGACGTLNITANGNNAPIGNGWDGCGGGGAGGSIVFIVPNWNVSPTCPIAVTGNGGSGGSVNSSTHGGGAGGGQGVVFFTSSAPANVSVATTQGQGGCNNNASPCDRAADGENIGTNVYFNSSTPLPVELLYFYARKIGDRQVALQWATQRLSVIYFEVEKAVEQARNFQTIGSVPARSSLQQENYQLSDDNFSNQTTYYRLKVHFADGRTDYSKIVSVSGSGEEKNLFNVYPNPFEREFWIENTNESVEKIVVQDLWGRELFAISQPKRIEKIDLTAYPKGTYFVLIISQEKTQVKKVIKL
jgi:hypothetical protein